MHWRIIVVAPWWSCRSARRCKDWDLVFVHHGGRDEPESIRVKHGIGRLFRFDRGRVAGDAPARAAGFVMRVLVIFSLDRV